MLAKISIAVIFSALILHTGVLSAPQLEAFNLQVRNTSIDDINTDNSTSITPDTSLQTFLNNVLKVVIEGLLSVLVRSTCTLVTPYLYLINLFQSTALQGSALILEFVSSLVSSFWPDLAGGVSEASNALTWVSSTVANATSYINKLGCSAA